MSKYEVLIEFDVTECFSLPRNCKRMEVSMPPADKKDLRYINLDERKDQSYKTICPRTP